jgi:hypothetical protein
VGIENVVVVVVIIFVFISVLFVLLCLGFDLPPREQQAQGVAAAAPNSNKVLIPSGLKPVYGNDNNNNNNNGNKNNKNGGDDDDDDGPPLQSAQRQQHQQQQAQQQAQAQGATLMSAPMPATVATIANGQQQFLPTDGQFQLEVQQQQQQFQQYLAEESQQTPYRDLPFLTDSSTDKGDQRTPLMYQQLGPEDANDIRRPGAGTAILISRPITQLKYDQLGPEDDVLLSEQNDAQRVYPGLPPRNIAIRSNAVTSAPSAMLDPQRHYPSLPPRSVQQFDDASSPAAATAASARSPTLLESELGEFPEPPSIEMVGRNPEYKLRKQHAPLKIVNRAATVTSPAPSGPPWKCHVCNAIYPSEKDVKIHQQKRGHM